MPRFNLACIYIKEHIGKSASTFPLTVFSNRPLQPPSKSLPAHHLWLYANLIYCYINVCTRTAWLRNLRTSYTFQCIHHFEASKKGLSLLPLTRFKKQRTSEIHITNIWPYTEFLLSYIPHSRHIHAKATYWWVYTCIGKTNLPGGS
jgi:hypothetical protein